jgi:hypothetical protein
MSATEQDGQCFRLSGRARYIKAACGARQFHDRPRFWNFQTQQPTHVCWIYGKSNEIVSRTNGQERLVRR